MSIQITNNPKGDQAVTKIQYVDRVVMAPAPAPVSVESLVYVDRPVEVLKTVEVPVDHIIEREVSVDLEPLKKQILEISQATAMAIFKLNTELNKAGTELEMQRRALVAIKTQRDIDRSR